MFEPDKIPQLEKELQELRTWVSHILGRVVELESALNPQSESYRGEWTDSGEAIKLSPLAMFEARLAALERLVTEGLGANMQIAGYGRPEPPLPMQEQEAQDAQRDSDPAKPNGGASPGDRTRDR